MSDEIVFYTNPQSRARIASWMLEEVGAPYRKVTLDYGAQMNDPAYLAINPMGKVPAIVHHGQVVTECAAICAYLADAFPEAGLAPPPARRAAYYRWLFFAAGPLEAAVTNKALGVEVPEDKSAFVGYGDGLDRVLDTLETALGEGHVAGPGFTAADVYVGSQIGWGMMFGTIPKRPTFVGYWDRLKDRPALGRAGA
jgi:glutathione S-transferase